MLVLLTPFIIKLSRGEKMKLGEKLYELRKEKNLSQEEVANILNVSRQTVSKWETGGTTPDFDKIVPLCNLYGITTDELLTGNKKEQTPHEFKREIQKKKAFMYSISVSLYILSVVFVIIFGNIKDLEILGICLFLIIIAIATGIIIYTSMVYDNKETKKIKIKTKENNLYKTIDEALALLTLIIYMFISFLTMAWHITWIMWIIYALIMQIIKLVFNLKGNDVDEE